MEEYVQYREVDENIPIKCPIHDKYNNPPNYRIGDPILSTQNYRNVNKVFSLIIHIDLKIYSYKYHFIQLS